MSSDLRGIFGFFIFLGKGREGKGFGVANVNWGFEKPASYQQVTSKLVRGDSMGIKVEFGGFIGGFGKIFFTKGEIKREKRGVLGMGWGREREKGGKSRVFGLRRRWDVIWNIP